MTNKTSSSKQQGFTFSMKRSRLPRKGVGGFQIEERRSLCSKRMKSKTQI
ncbi:hypothetical protein LINPERHAP2_LOCUS32639 [Linum perenne]